MEPNEKLKTLIHAMVSALVEDEKSVSIQMSQSGTMYHYDVMVDERDTGKIIRKRGKNITAMRTILNATATSHGMKVTLELINERRPQREGSDFSI